MLDHTRRCPSPLGPCDCSVTRSSARRCAPRRKSAHRRRLAAGWVGCSVPLTGGRCDL